MDVKPLSRQPRNQTNRRRSTTAMLVSLVAVLSAFMAFDTVAFAQVAHATQNSLASPAAGDANLGFSDILWTLVLAIGGFLYVTCNRSV